MEDDYQKIVDYMLNAGKRIKEKAGQIADIGVIKKYLTEEDLAIERGFSELINTFEGEHIIFAEEENADFEENENVWAIDPISATSAFIGGIPHYAIVCSHIHLGRVVFAAVYDPSVDEMFIAKKDRGAFLNGQKIQVGSRGKQRIILNFADEFWRGKPEARKAWDLSFDQNAFRNSNSYAVNYSWVAAGRFDGVIALTKDAFPEFAGKLMIEEAGGVFTNIDRDEDVSHSDRFFVGGRSEVYNELIELSQKQMMD